jgi:chromosome partitioning protein
MVYIVAVANQKGGVAKTTSAANMAAGAAERGLRVLLVDLDPQGSASTLTDVEPRSSKPDDFGNTRSLTISDALYAAQERDTAQLKPGTVLAVAVPAGEHWPAGLQVAPANEDLTARGDETFEGAERRLAVALSGAQEHFDLVVLDCPPSLGPLFLNAMYAADGVLLVTEPADASIDSLPRAARTVLRVRAARADQGKPELLGIVATNAPAQEGRALELLEDVRREYGELLWDVIPHRSVVRRAEGARAPLLAFGASSREVTAAYGRITDRLLQQVSLISLEVV